MPSSSSSATSLRCSASGRTGAAHVAHGLAAPGALRPVQRGVGVLEQHRGVDAVGRGGGHARGRGQRTAAHGQLGQGGTSALGTVLGGMDVGTRQDQHELLATEATDRVAAPHHRAQPLGGRGQHAVALGVAVGVVDDLEVIEIEQDHGDRIPVGQRLAQPLVAGAMVEQPGQPVAPDLLAQRVALAGGVVRERGHRREPLDELDLLVGEAHVLAVAVDVQRTEHPLGRQQRHAHERLGLVERAGDDVRERLGCRRSAHCACSGWRRPNRSRRSRAGSGRRAPRRPSRRRRTRGAGPRPARRSRRPSDRRSAGAHEGDGRSARASPPVSRRRESPRQHRPALQAQIHAPHPGPPEQSHPVSRSEARQLDAYTCANPAGVAQLARATAL